MNKIYPSGGHYPETKEDYAEHFFDLLAEAEPSTLNRAAHEWRKMGGKFAALADLLSGVIDIHEFERLAEQEGWNSED